MAIIISKKGQPTSKIEKSPFPREDFLQRYIYENPESIPLYDIKEDIRLLILVREFPTPSGPIDAVGIDQDGEIYLIETKLYKNPDKRTVVAQVLDYGASLWRSQIGFQGFVEVIEQRLRETHGTTLEERVKGFFGLEETDARELLEGLKENLNAGNLRFVVLMDKLHDQLRDLIVFLNQNSRFHLFAVEVDYYKYQDYEIVIPKLFGAEVKKDTRLTGGGSARSKWDEQRFFVDAGERLSEAQLAAMRKLFDSSRSLGAELTWGTGGKVGSFNAVFDRILTASIYTVRSNGVLRLNFGQLAKGGETAKQYRDEFGRALMKVNGFKIPSDYRDTWVRIPPETWCPRVDEFIAVVKNLVDKEFS